jgi:superfamily II DNA or RNA helicase
MQTTVVQNDYITIQNPSTILGSIIREELTYVDKSKQYQLRRLGKTTWGRNSPLYKQLQLEVNGQLYTESSNSIVIPSSFYESFKDHLSNGSITDNRKETGAKIVCPWVNKPHDLRPYQQEAVDLMLSNYRGVINFATGLGKTLVATHFIKSYKKKALVICPSDSVARQFYDQFVNCFGPKKVGFYGGGKKKISDITVGIAASVTRNIDEFRAADLGVIIFDETHHTPASTFFDIAEGIAGIGKVFGLTATDYRSDGKDIMITAGCGSVLIRRDIKWGVDNGFLATPYFIVRQVATGGRDFKDDKLKSYKEHVLNNQIMKDRILNDAKSMMAAGKAVLVLVDEVAHGEELSKALGVPFATGEDKKSQDYVDQLNDGKIPGLIGTDGKVGEGTDTKNVDVLILANFVASKGPVIQAIGRGLRKQGIKDKCLILDYIPMGSTMLSRHANNRIGYYEEITDKIKVITI